MTKMKKILTLNYITECAPKMPTFSNNCVHKMQKYMHKC